MAKKKSKKGKPEDELKKKKKGSKSVSGKKQKVADKAGAKKSQKSAKPPVFTPDSALPVDPVENTPQEATAADLSEFEVSYVPVDTESLMPADGLTAPQEAYFDLASEMDAPDEQIEDLDPELSVPDGWRIDLDFDLPLLIFTRGDIELFTLPLSENFLENLLPRLNQLHLSQTEAATSWQVRLPEDNRNPPVFSMMKNGAVAASIPLTDEVMNEMLPVLERFDTRKTQQKEKPLKRFGRWMRAHKIRAALLLLVTIPLAGYVLFAIGMQIFFTPSR